ncbi:Plectin/S10 domain-domain-containing protein [Protomyces lactucae-debilis]|uniref:Plectin/S10 domain-domain-containing protein n=1 Tax=Protomyces lactucae-debilis TaxID=2754530 RepID=A0A1Y2FAE5_PROLT|nr:Plectin/S10 domain-containing protein [Protomyces lactucae-debilis]ORY80890.1 Plectin/S10 domain-domain-containing protein [Protomyces lactucae-debilis]
MLVPKENRRKIYQQLFKDGVLVAKKDFNAPASLELEDVPNLQVIKVCQSLTSKGFVKTQFSWQYYYYSLTNEGIDHLREWLHLPVEIVPATHKRATRPAAPRTMGGPQGGAPRQPRREGGADEYRRRDGGEKKQEGDVKPVFREGF